MAKANDREYLLGKIREAAEARRRARRELERVEEKMLMPLIIRAVEAHVPLREVGEAAGVSHVTIMRMLDRRGYYRT